MAAIFKVFSMKLPYIACLVQVQFSLNLGEKLPLTSMAVELQFKGMTVCSTQNCSVVQKCNTRELPSQHHYLEGILTVKRKC